jgi:cold shock CspA family protein
MHFAALALPSESLTIQGLPATLTNEQLDAVFSQYGTVEQCKMLDPLPGSPICGALVQMQTVEEGTWLVQNLNGNIPSGLTTPITVQYQTVADVSPQPVVNDFAILTAAVQVAAGMGLGPPAVPLAPVPIAPVPEPAPPQFQVGISLRGTVKRWDDQKGFGFIVPDGGGPDVFVHVRELMDGEKLVNGSQVIFEAMQDPAKGPGRYRAKTCKGALNKDKADVQTPATDNLFITGLPLDITEEMIQATFSQYGTIHSVKKLGNQPGKSDAAALVRMGDVEQAKWLVENLHTNIPTGLKQPVNIRFAENKGAGVGAKGAAPLGLGALGKMAINPLGNIFAPY